MVNLLNRLHRLTSMGKIEWELTETDETFQTSFLNYSVRIFPQGSDYRLSVLNSEGIVVETVNDPGLFEVSDTAYADLKGLHELARSYALGGEQALDEIINALDENDI